MLVSADGNAALCVCAGTEQNLDEDLMAVPDVPGESPNHSRHGTAGQNGLSTPSMHRKGSVTLNLSEVDEDTLRDFEVSDSCLQSFSYIKQIYLPMLL